MPKQNFPSGAALPSAIDATRRLLSQRGLSIPTPDIGDVVAAVDGLASALAKTSKSLDMTTVPAPFQATLKGLAEPGQLHVDGSAPLSAEGLAAGQVSSEEWVRECLRNIESAPPARLAWREVDADNALALARKLDEERLKGRVRGPLHGVPIGVKDMIDRRGRIAGWGSRLREGAAPADEDATILTRLQQAGAIVLGTQHMAEFAMSPTGLNATFGPGRNPWNTDHVSGGSSSGGGMSVAAGHVPLAIGSDTGGSIRLPAALCGITGLKPTQYRVSLAGVMPLSPSLDCVGPLGRSAEACGWAYAAMAGTDPRDPSCLDLPAPMPTWMRDPSVPLRVAVPDLTGSDLVSADMSRVFLEARRALAESGVQCVDAAMPDIHLYGHLGSILLAVESVALHRRWLGAEDKPYGRQIRRRLSRGYLIAGMDYYDALRLREPLLRQFLSDIMRGADALLLPATPDIAPRVIDTTQGDEATLEREFSRLSAWTRGINYLGVPALSVPAGVGAANLPLGVQLIGRPLGEHSILALGRLFQKTTDWHRRMPAHVDTRSR